MTPVQADLAKLIGFPTVSDRPVTALAAWLAERMEGLGLRVDRFDDPRDKDKCSLVASIGPTATDGLVLSGHMDVVPTEGQPWTSDPFEMTERAGVLYGRGTADMKGFFAATLQALARIEPREYRRELVIVWTHDEEVGCLGSRVLVEQLKEDGRPLPTACLIGEPTDFQILRMHPGHVAVQCSIEGQAAHSSRPDLGSNAITGAARLILHAEELAAQLRAEAADLPEMERPWVALNVARIAGGSAINIVPDHAVVDIGYRPLPGMAPSEVMDRLLSSLPQDLRSRTKGHVVRATPALLTERGTVLEGALAAHTRCDAVGAASFATDGGNLASLGMKPLVFGPGSITVAHQADEHIAAADLAHAIDVIEAIVRQRCCT
jgi:acetylornithine deacetylase